MSMPYGILQSKYFLNFLPVPGVIGTLQALEVMKIALKIGEPLVGRLLLFDALSCSFRTVKLRPKKDDCLVCGKAPKITQLIDYEEFCGAPACDKVYDTLLY